ncbi:hypothetical protein SAMN04489727_3675 [Amycolatopsis tolypomycina]|uniref:MYXO-CTERM domain-containing protein n=1 Tax=Amycolatopsis tolypomycina TaxID=208445 RepID=A0A1H4SC18_9PSEU|nr:hypothetical protein [Amycolatopsis tolypomycina]SEC41702.1 hypothetical protein SAMN04489727_3675 [Amycolatopsis tolypomycina]
MTHRLGRAQQVILLCLLALCVTAMHHISASSNEPDTMAAVATSMPTADTADEHPEPAHNGPHDLLHLCLAILTALGSLLLLAWLLLPRQPGTPNPAQPTSPRGSPAPDRPPDRPGRTILTSLCVLRV